MTSVAAKLQQKHLVDYLNLKVDPYDFQFAIRDWVRDVSEDIDTEETDIVDDAQIDDLTEGQLKRFTVWLEKQHSERWVEELGPHAPSYLFFDYAKALPVKTWCVHLTNASPFTTFEYGTLMWELGLTRHFTDEKRRANKAECDVAPDERQQLYGFAFKADDRKWRWGGGTRKYGKNAVFFQHDSAVLAYHGGDDEEQVIFDICGAYNAVPVLDISAINGGGTVVTDEGELELGSWEEIIAWAEKPKSRRKKALGSLIQAPRRWAQGVKVPNGTFVSLFKR